MCPISTPLRTLGAVPGLSGCTRALSSPFLPKTDPLPGVARWAHVMQSSRVERADRCGHTSSITLDETAKVSVAPLVGRREHETRQKFDAAGHGERLFALAECEHCARLECEHCTLCVCVCGFKRRGLNVAKVSSLRFRGAQCVLKSYSWRIFYIRKRLNCGAAAYRVVLTCRSCGLRLALDARVRFACVFLFQRPRLPDGAVNSGPL